MRLFALAALPGAFGNLACVSRANCNAPSICVDNGSETDFTCSCPEGYVSLHDTDFFATTDYEEDDWDVNGVCIKNDPCSKTLDYDSDYSFTNPDFDETDPSCAKEPPAAPVEWTAWKSSECSVTCGSGSITKTRTCPEEGKCPGEDTDTDSCKLEPCPVWSSWTDGACSVECGEGTITRTRTCPVDKACPGEAEESKPCRQAPCPIDGGLSQWTKFGECVVSDAKAGTGKQSRTRTCTAPVPAFNGKDCEGDLTEEQDCSVPVWSEWKESACSVTCGEGTVTRTRTCPKEKACAGEAEESKPCTQPKCPVWSAWTDSACSVTCGEGTITRTRTCPIEKACPGEATESKPCTEKKCPVWSAWTDSACSVTCGEGTVTRTRICPIKDACPGKDTENQKCTQKKCPVWSAWNDSACSVTCGEGTITRTRTCPLEKACPGEAEESKKCTQPKCPVWTSWSKWGDCDADCDGGKQGRSRVCPIKGACPGAETEIQECNNQACPKWGYWSAWSECTKTCGGGSSSRARKCSIQGKCEGPASETRECNKAACPTWSPWAPWTSCSVTCGNGKRHRTRNCPVNYACPGDATEFQECREKPCDSTVRCPVDMTYLDAKQFCGKHNMKLPRPYSMAENERMTKLGATWMEVVVNEIFGLDERFENWKGRQRGFLCPDGKWQVLGPMDKRPCHCVKEVQDNMQCKDVFYNNPRLMHIKNGDWQFKQDDRSFYGPFTQHSLEQIQLGSKLQYRCKGRKQCRGFVCVRTGNGNSAFVRCKGPSCKNWFNRKPFDFNECSLACSSGRTLKCY